MRLKRLIAGTIMAGTLAGAALPAFAEELFVPLFSYRTGPFAGSGIPIANGMHDYLTMLNERDGGINGVKIRVSRMRNRL
jgi:branched-chain amino acid transport system substrate-binding protein